MQRLGGTPICPMCSKAVYFAEEVRAIGKAFHKLCLKCSQCKKTLDASQVNDHEGVVYCNSCYAKNYGPKGYGFAGGKAGLSSENGRLEQENQQPHAVNASNSVTAGPVSWREKQASVASNKFANLGGGGELCATCGQRVYHNERTDCAGRVYHKLCFKCFGCGKLLEKGSVNEHESQVYCKGCYVKNYGTKGFVAGTSMHVS